MKTTYVSTFALTSANRRSVVDMQAELATRQQEMTTGRVADAALALGGRAGEAVSLHREHASLDALVKSNALATSRLDATQELLTAVGDGAADFMKTLIQAREAPSGAANLVARAREGLGTLIGQLNASHNGEHIFAGINSDVSPIDDYFGTGSTARQAIGDAFVLHFGFGQSDAAAKSITAAAMQDFLDTDFADLFGDAGWAGAWSSASDNVASSQIGNRGAAATGVSANSPPIRQLAMAYSMVSDLGVAGLSADAYGAVVNSAIKTLGGGQAGIIAMQASLGATQQSVSDSSERMSLQMDVIARHINALESVDPYEAATRVTTLMTQIETSYAMTARIQQLSLLNFL